MKLRSIFCTLLLVSAGWTLGTQAAFAEDLKIGVLNWQGALLGTKKVQDRLKKLRSEFSAEEGEVKRVAKEVDDLQKKMKKDGAVMSDSEKVKMAKKLEEGLSDYKYLGSKLQKQVNERQQEILFEMRPNLERAVKDVIDAGKYDLVLDGQALLFVKPSHDITGLVTKKLNEIL